MWELGEQVSDVFSQWIIHDGELRAKADPRYSLCVRRDGCTNGGYLHMWSFGGPPDIYGQWEIQPTEDSLVNGRLPLTPQLVCRADQDSPLDREGAGLLETVVRNFQEALVVEEELDRVTDLNRHSFVRGLDAFSQALNSIGGRMGSYISSEVGKFRKAHAARGEDSYRAWLFSELPVHETLEYKSYVDDSACMANLWIARNLDFFVQFLSFLRDGLETNTSVDMAYRKTLQDHHDFFQRVAFSTAALQLPSRQGVLRALEGPARGADVAREIVALASCGRRIVAFCTQLSKELEAAMVERRGKLEMDQAYGRAGW